jgi:hypothetical protein
VFRSQRGTFDKGLQPGPGNLWVSSAAEAAVGAGDNALRAKDFCEALTGAYFFSYVRPTSA